MKYYVWGFLVLVLALLVFIIWPTDSTTVPEAVVDTSEIKFGFIREVKDADNEYVLVFDDAEWLTDAAAQDAAIEAGQCTEATREECVPNNFFIRNPDPATTELALAGDVVIAMATLNMEQEGVKETPVTAQEFADLINNANAPWSKLPYQMVVENGVVTILEEVYVP